MPLSYRGKPLTASRIVTGLPRLVRKTMLRLTPGRHVRSSYGPLLTKRSGDMTFQLSALGIYGNLIPNVLTAIEEPFVFLDIGANAGVFSLLAASQENCECVVAVEPIPRTFATLVNNIEINRATKIIPLCGAIAQTTEPLVRMTFDQRHSGSAHIASQSSNAASTVLAPVISHSLLSDILENTNAQRIALKIDVEGAESQVLNALHGEPWFSRIADAVIELSTLTAGGLQNIDAVYSLMTEYGFEEVTTPPQTSDSEVHYDGHFTRRSKGAEGRTTGVLTEQVDAERR